MHRQPLLVIAVVATVLTVLQPLTAQDQGGSVPADVMDLLLQGAITRDFELRVGSAPEGFPQAVLPEGTRLVAAAVSARGTTVVGTLARPAPEGIAGHERALGEEGWITVGPPRQAFARGPELLLYVCRGTDFVTIGLLPREQGGQYVRAVHTRDERRPCAARPGMSLSDVVVPTLLPPQGARVEGGSGGGNMDAHYWTVRLHTSMRARDVLRHYANQLVAAGWRLDGSEDVSGVAVARVVGATVNGQPVTGLLIVTPLQASGDPVLDAFLRLIRNQPQE
jgi:hypothetical protein